uniref:UPA domain-containing protein n=1 Tax=Timema poppense TaxID=170557 RepID=A0A7R9CNQ4_TIMPO|nr:unnamed protein product [Timema poppensis]
MRLLATFCLVNTRLMGWFNCTYVEETWTMSKLLGCALSVKVVVLGEETINTPMFTQLDHNQVYLITDQLMRFVIVGESDKNLNKAVKILCLAVFAPAPEFHPQMLDYNVRVYTLEDTVAALEGVKVMENKLGGCLLDKPKTMLFQDGGANLCLSIEDICPGWRCKPQADYQVE